MKANNNIQYKTEAIDIFYSSHRLKWSQLYPSEKAIFELSEIIPTTSILDIGCGCGGLGLALAERFLIYDYTGVDISSAAIASAKKMNPKANFISGDILDIKDEKFESRKFDLVVSLGCVDWNIEFERMVNLAWSYVRPGGRLISTFRLTDKLEIEPSDSLKKSYQYINFNGEKEGEIAPYVVLNANKLLSRLLNYSPREIIADGYWGAPSKSAVTPYEEICFSAFSIQKNMSNDIYTNPIINLRLPEEILVSCK